MPDNPAGALRMGIVGCANIAVRRILSVLAAHESVRLVAVASRGADKARRVAAAFGCAGVVGYRALLARDDIDAVYVPLPPGMHHEWVAEALDAGKHVLVEKPLSTSYAQTVELVQMARERGLVLAENFMFLHHSQHDAMCGLIADGTIGEMRVFTSSFGVPPLDPASFRYRPDLGGGALLDVGVYPLRAAQLYIPAELEVLGACLRVDETTGVDVAGSAMLCTAEGVTVQVDFGFEHSYRSMCALWGSNGRISLARAFTPPEHHRPVVRIEQQDRLSELTLPADHQVHNALDAFVTAVLARMAPDCIATARPAPYREESILRQARLVEQVRRAATVVRSTAPGRL